MDAGRRHKIPGSKTKGNLLLTATAAARVSVFVSIPWDPVPTGRHEEGQVTLLMLHQRRETLSAGNWNRL